MSNEFQNEEIANELIISDKAVEKHASSVGLLYGNRINKE